MSSDQKQKQAQKQIQKYTQIQIEQEAGQINNKPFQSLDQMLDLKNKLKGFSQKTLAGINAKGPKTNQDSMIIMPNFMNSRCIHLFVALDGHGLYGHLVSNYVKRILPQNLESVLKRDGGQIGSEQFIRNCIRIAFFQTSKQLLQSAIDCTFSGTTCVLVLIIGDVIYCGNIGDSRAVLGSFGNSMNESEQNQNIKLQPLSRDHKPDDPIEKERIYKKGGRVDTYRDADGEPLGPARVWLSDRDLPGLAMARSFGDLVAVQAGVICDPEISVHYMQKSDKMIVMGSDGIWEFVENEQVFECVQPYYQKCKPDMACLKLVNLSLQMWKQNDDVVDDITCIVIFLQE